MYDRKKRCERHTGMTPKRILWSLVAAGYVSLTGCEKQAPQRPDEFRGDFTNAPLAELPEQKKLQATPVSMQLANPNQDKPSEDDATFWKLLSAYYQCTAYSDRAYALLRYRTGNQMAEDKAPLSVRWQSPNRIEVKAYDARLIGDSRFMWTWVEDPTTNAFDGQVARRPSPLKQSLEELLRDPIFTESAAAGLAGPPPQLTWLFVPPPEKDRPAVKRLEDGLIENASCARYQMGQALEARVFWCEKSTGLVKRIELPPPPTPGATEVRLSVEFEGAAFRHADKPIIEGLPQDHRLVTALVPPPTPITPLLGNRPATFRFQSNDQRLQITDAGSGKPVVLVWFADHPASQAVLKDLQRFADEQAKQVDVLAIMAEPQPTRDTGDLLRAWHVGLSWTNDVNALGRDVFRIQEAPTLMVLDEQGSSSISLRGGRIS